jgi:polysaccharide pyruvyl transferase CsaB
MVDTSSTRRARVPFSRMLRRTSAGSPKHVRSCMVTGYYGHGNFGDESLLGETLDFLQELPFQVKVQVVSECPLETARRFDVAVVPARNLWRRAMAVARADIVLVGGGGLLKDTSIRGGLSVGAALIDVVLGIVFGRTCLMFGVGMGRIRHRRGRLFLKALLNRLQLLVVRDDASRKQLADLGVKDSILQVGADLVYSNLTKGTTHRDEPSSVRVGVSLPGSDLYWAEVESGLSVDRLLAVIALAVEATFNDRQITVVLASLHEGAEFSDSRVLDDLEAMFTDVDQVVRCDFSRSWVPDVLQEFQSFDIMIAMRFHAVVMASLANVPFLPLVWDEKVWQLCFELGVIDGIVDLREGQEEDIVNRLKDVWTDRVTRVESAQRCVRELHQRLDRSKSLVGNVLTLAPKPGPFDMGLGLILLLSICASRLSSLIGRTLRQVPKRSQKKRPRCSSTVT